MQTYRPPYFFQGARPVIDVMPPGIDIGSGQSQINVTITTGAQPAWVALLRPGYSTHNYDASQRYVVLNINQETSVGGSWVLTVDNPPTPEVTPPGHYMLTVVDTTGLPSPAKFVLVK